MPPKAVMPAFQVGQATVPLPGMAAPKVTIQPASPKIDPIDKEDASML